MDAFQDKWPRWRQLTSTAAHRGMLCFGANNGRKVTYGDTAFDGPPHRGVRLLAGADSGRRRLVRFGPGAGRTLGHVAILAGLERY